MRTGQAPRVDLAAGYEIAQHTERPQRGRFLHRIYEKIRRGVCSVPACALTWLVMHERGTLAPTLHSVSRGATAAPRAATCAFRNCDTRWVGIDLVFHPGGSRGFRFGTLCTRPRHRVSLDPILTTCWGSSLGQRGSLPPASSSGALIWSTKKIGAAASLFVSRSPCGEDRIRPQHRIFVSDFREPVYEALMGVGHAHHGRCSRRSFRPSGPVGMVARSSRRPRARAPCRSPPPMSKRLARRNSLRSR